MAARAKSAPTVYVALLRGVNVGGNNIVSMAALRDSFARLGAQDVATYINSGNVLFRSRETDPRKLERKIDRMLEAEHGLKGRTIVRNASEMARLIETISKTWKRHADWRYNVIFLRHAIDSESVLDGLKPKPEIERVVYCPGTLLWCARLSGLTRTDMLKLASRSIYQEMTVRNVNTTMKLFELMQRMERQASVRTSRRPDPVRSLV